MTMPGVDYCAAMVLLSEISVKSSMNLPTSVAERVKRVAICLARTNDAGGAEVVAYRLREKLEANRIDVEIVWIPHTFFPSVIYKSITERSKTDRIALSALGFVDVWLNFAETSLRALDYDLLVTLHWNTLYLRHPNMIVYFLHQERTAYDLYAHVAGNLSILGKAAFFAQAVSRRLVDRSVVSRIRSERMPVIAISRNVAKRLVRYWHVQARRIIYPGGYDPIFHDDSRDYVLYFGRLDWSVKRLSLVYSVARMLPEIPFVVAGGPLHRLVDPRILDLPNNVRLELFNGLCPMIEKARIYSHASCVLYPSLDEDFGIVPVEAMSAGKPCVVCTDGGGVTETVVHGKTGLVVPSTPEALALAVKQLHRSGASMKEDCEERAKMFSWDRCLDELFSEIQRSL